MWNDNEDGLALSANHLGYKLNVNKPVLFVFVLFFKEKNKPGSTPVALGPRAGFFIALIPRFFPIC